MAGKQGIFAPNKAAAMTIARAERMSAAGSGGRRHHATTDRVARAVGWRSAARVTALATLCAALTLASGWPLARAVLAGAFADPDDALRLVEVRAWMAGQPWFDVSALRLDPPAGASMHWSRLVDLPNAILIKLLGMVSAQPDAWDRILLPTLWLVALYAGMAVLASILLGRQAQLAALLGTFFSGVTLVQFQPGRIGHHAPDTVALVWAVATLLASFGRGRGWMAAVAGVFTALSLATSLETLPLLGALGVVAVSAWLLRGAATAPVLRSYCLGLGASLLLLFAVTTDPHLWFAPVCDRLGAAHLGAALLACIGGSLLAGASSRLATVRSRVLAAMPVAALALGFVALAYPACLGSPFAGVDPLVRAIWLDHVVESQPLLAFLRARPSLGLAMAVPMALGVLAGALAARRLRGEARLGFATLAFLGGFGLLMGCWQVRVLAAAAPLCLCGGLYAVEVLRAGMVARGLALAARFAPIAILPFATTAWAMVLPDDPEPAAPRAACLAPAAIRPLATLPPGRVLAPIEAGSHLLEATPHTVFAAPYHRNNDGNRFALDAWLAKPSAARTLLASRRVAYVVTCPGFGETAALAARAPDGLAAALLDGRTPAFLHELPLDGTPYRVFAVGPAPVR